MRSYRLDNLRLRAIVERDELRADVARIDLNYGHRAVRIRDRLQHRVWLRQTGTLQVLQT